MGLQTETHLPVARRDPRVGRVGPGGSALVPGEGQGASTTPVTFLLGTGAGAKRSHDSDPCVPSLGPRAGQPWSQTHSDSKSKMKTAKRALEAWTLSLSSGVQGGSCSLAEDGNEGLSALFRGSQALPRGDTGPSAHHTYVPPGCPGCPSFPTTLTAQLGLLERGMGSSGPSSAGVPPRAFQGKRL